MPEKQELKALGVTPETESDTIDENVYEVASSFTF